MHRVCLVLALTLAGCSLFGAEAPGATLTAALAADEATLRLVNTGETAIEFGALPCSADLEVREGEDWQLSPYEPLILCLPVLSTLEPGAVEEVTYPVAGLPTGTYRFRLTVVNAGGGGVRTVFSNETVR